MSAETNDTRKDFEFVVCTECGRATQEPTYQPTYLINTPVPSVGGGGTFCKFCLERKHAAV
jgi:hypothetical protein